MPAPRSDFDIAISVLMTAVAALGERIATEAATALPVKSAARDRRLADIDAYVSDAAALIAGLRVLVRHGSRLI